MKDMAVNLTVQLQDLSSNNFFFCVSISPWGHNSKPFKNIDE